MQPLMSPAWYSWHTLNHRKGFGSYKPHMGGYQHCDPLLGPLNTRCRIILRTQKGTIVLTTTHMAVSTTNPKPTLQASDQSSGPQRPRSSCRRGPRGPPCPGPGHAPWRRVQSCPTPEPTLGLAAVAAVQSPNGSLQGSCIK